MKVLVIGGAGYIGSHTVYELIRNNHDTTVMDNLSTGKKEYVHKNAGFYEGDITKKKDLTGIFKETCNNKKIDVVMHFAAKLIVDESMKMPLEYYYNNVEGVRLMLETMAEFGIENIIFSSTAAVYGNPVNSKCTEEDITKPINPYGSSKQACEELIKWACLRYDMNYGIFRYFNVAGADETLEIGLDKDNLTHLIPVTIQTALGMREKVYIYGDDYDTIDGTCIRDYIHVTDLAKAHVLGANYLVDKDKSFLLNLGSEKGYSVKEVVDAVSKIRPVNYEVVGRREGDPTIIIASSEKAKELLDWKTSKTLDDIINSDMEFRLKKLKR